VPAADVDTAEFMDHTSVPVESRASGIRIPTTVKVVGFCLLAALAAQVRVPVPGSPVPMTLQSFVVVLAGLSLSPAAAAAAMLLYVGLGTAGLPFFAPGSLGVFGPTGGYLVGFVVAAWLTSCVCGHSRNSWRLAVSAAAGLGALFAVGVVWLSLYTGGELSAALAAGVAPFVLKGFLEVALAVSIVRQVGRRFHSTF